MTNLKLKKRNFKLILLLHMEKDFTNENALSGDNCEKMNKDLNIKTLNPEKDLLYFLKLMNFKLSENKVKYPKVRLIY